MTIIITIIINIIKKAAVFALCIAASEPKKRAIALFLSVSKKIVDPLPFKKQHVGTKKEKDNLLISRV